MVIVEGNYLLLNEGVWKEVSSLFDEKWFIEVDIDTAMQRVCKRHISTAGKPQDVAKWRVRLVLLFSALLSLLLYQIYLQFDYFMGFVM